MLVKYNMLEKYKSIINAIELGKLSNDDPNGHDYVKGHNHAIDKMIIYLQQIALKDLNKSEYTWISIIQTEPLPVCILDIKLFDDDLNGMRETYPAYKNANDNDEWYVLFTNTSIKSIAGNFEIINWMPFPEANTN